MQTVSLTYHHVALLPVLNERFEEWKIALVTQQKFVSERLSSITIGELYLPENEDIATMFIDEYSRFMANYALEIATGVVRNPWMSNDHYEDYVMPDGSGAAAFQEGTAKVYRSILTSPPESTLEASYKLDDQCGACQRKKEGTSVGIHCVEEQRGYHNYVWFRILLRMQEWSGRSVIPPRFNDIQLIRETPEGPMITLPLGLLRDQEWLDSVFEIIKEGVHTEVNRELSSGLLIGGDVLRYKSGILAEVTEAHMRGERLY